MQRYTKGLLVLSVMANMGVIGVTNAQTLGKYESRAPEAGFVLQDGNLSHPMNFSSSNATTIYSTNWSGAGQSDALHNFTDVSAFFNMPTSIQCNSTSDLVAAWTGLNGFSNGFVEQTGIAISCATGAPTFQGWYEMFPALPVYLSSTTYPVSAGDTILAGVQNSAGSYTLTLWNYTKGWTFQTIQTQSDQTTATSAEAVVEIPFGFHNPNFGTIPFGLVTGNMTPGGNGTVFATPLPGYPPIYTIDLPNKATSTGIVYHPGYALNPDMQVTYVGP